MQRGSLCLLPAEPGGQQPHPDQAEHDRQVHPVFGCGARANAPTQFSLPARWHSPRTSLGRDGNVPGQRSSRCTPAAEAQAPRATPACPWMRYCCHSQKNPGSTPGSNPGATNPPADPAASMLSPIARVFTRARTFERLSKTGPRHYRIWRWLGPSLGGRSPRSQ